MKKIFIGAFSALMFIGACTWVNEEDLEAMGPDEGDDDDMEEPVDSVDCSTITLSGNIATIIQTNCASASCHGGNRSPLLTTNEEIIAAASRIKARTGAGTMPPSRPLSSEDIEAIACWVDAGAPNN